MFLGFIRWLLFGDLELDMQRLYNETIKTIIEVRVCLWKLVEAVQERNRIAKGK